jgi:MGT family glycosyltransferase
MSRFLFTVWPLRSHVNPFMAVAHALRDRGHEVAFYTGAAAFSIVRQECFRCFAFNAVSDERVERAFRTLASRSRNPRSWRELMLGTVPDQLRDLDAIWKSWQPDVIVCDMAMWGPILVTHEVRKIPVTILSHIATCLLPDEDHPMPGVDWLREDRRARPIAAMLARILRVATAGIPRAANKLRESWDLPPISGTVTEFTGQMPLYLVPGTPSFDGSRRDLPLSVHYVGPCLWDQNPGQPSPEWVGRIPRDRPCAIVAEGSMFPEEPLILKAAAKGLANRNLSVILLPGEGRRIESLNLESLPPNIRLEKSVALSDVLPIADVVITNGDSETALASLSHGLPMVLVPVILDQPQISRRVSAAGAGLRLSPRGARQRDSRRQSKEC